MRFSGVKDSTSAENVVVKVDKAGTPIICAGLAGAEVAPLEVLTVTGTDPEDEKDTDASWSPVYIDGSAFQFSASENIKVVEAIGSYRIKVPSSASNTRVGSYKG